MSDVRGLRQITARGALRVPTGVAPAQASTLTAKPPGAPVRRGEALASASATDPAVLSPITGVVGNVSTIRLTTGEDVLAVAVEPIAEAGESPAGPLDGVRPDAEAAARLKELLRMINPADLGRVTDEIRAAGVSADRWTSPDLLGQLHQCLKRPVDTIVCNALDFDDALPLQQAVTCANGLEIVAAVAALGAIIGATRALIAVDASAAEPCLRAIDRWAPQTGVRAVTLRNSFPQPNPTLLLHTLARRALRPGGLPTEVGAVVLDAVAAAAVGRCLLFGEPLLRTPVGIADMRPPESPENGRGNGRLHLLSASVGMSAAEVLREAGVTRGAFELRGSSPLREIRPGPDAVVGAGGEVALYLVAPQPATNPSPCVRCGWCVSGCPVHIQPAGILQAAQSDDPVAAERYGIESCIECGVCSYVCPSHLPLLAGIRALRNAARRP